MKRSSADTVHCLRRSKAFWKILARIEEYFVTTVFGCLSTAILRTSRYS